VANPDLPTAPAGGRLGYFMHKAGTTLTAVLGRALTQAPTTGATPTGHLATATHVEGAPASYADATGTPTPVALVAGKYGTPIAASSGQVIALQADVRGAVMAQTAGATSFATGQVLVGTTQATYPVGATCQRLRIYNNSLTATLYYKEITGITAANGFPIPPGGAQDELWINGALVTTIYLIASEASVDVRFREERA
jgi:hypothetical protein